jgi:glutaredoxin
MMQPLNIRIYGTRFCGDCYRVINYLREHNIPFQWIDIDYDPQAEQFVQSTNQGMRSVPTILFDDGSILVEPSRSELAQKLEQLQNS